MEAPGRDRCALDNALNNCRDRASLGGAVLSRAVRRVCPIEIWEDMLRFSSSRQNYKHFGSRAASLWRETAGGDTAQAAASLRPCKVAPRPPSLYPGSICFYNCSLPPINSGFRRRCSKMGPALLASCAEAEVTPRNRKKLSQRLTGRAPHGRK